MNRLTRIEISHGSIIHTFPIVLGTAPGIGYKIARNEKPEQPKKTRGKLDPTVRLLLQSTGRRGRPNHYGEGLTNQTANKPLQDTG